MSFFIFLIYNILFLIFSPLIIIIYLVNRDLNFEIPKRFCFFRNNKNEKFSNILIHCSSVGEATLGTSFFGKDFIYSTFNKAGYEYLKNKNYNVYPLPLDFFIFIYIFLKKLNIKKIVLIEQEIWPSLIIIAKFLKIKIYLFNGIIYDRSYRMQRLFKFIYSPLFNSIEKIFVQSEKDFNRFFKLGTKREKLEISGNLKLFYDKIDVNIDKKKEIISQFNKRILVFASFHNNEFDVIKEIYNKFKNCFLFVIAPRFFDEINKLIHHFGENNIYLISDLEKMNENNEINIENLNNESGKKEYLKNDEKYLFNLLKKCEINNKILILDKVGHLKEIYKFSYMVVVGGSFNNKGGQNFIEPIAYLNLTIIGPSFYNFDSVFNLFYQKSLFKVNNIDDLILLINKYYILNNSNDNYEFYKNLLLSQELILNYSCKFKDIKKTIVDKL